MINSWIPLIVFLAIAVIVIMLIIISCFRTKKSKANETEKEHWLVSLQCEADKEVTSTMQSIFKNFSDTRFMRFLKDLSIKKITEKELQEAKQRITTGFVRQFTPQNLGIPEKTTVKAKGKDRT